MISNYILVAASGLFAAAIYFHKKQKFYSSMFDDVHKAKNYHMDYIEDIEHLPINKYILLFGPPHSMNKSTFISPTFIEKQGQKDRLWKFNLKQRFYFQTASKQKVIVQGSPSDRIIAFNLPPTSRQLKDEALEQRAIINNVAVCCFGKITNFSNTYKIKPQIIIGNKHESLLVFLDKHILELNKKGKLFGALGVCVVAAHATYRFVLQAPKKTAIQLDMERTEIDRK